MSRAVTEAFVRLYEQGLMYRATRLINWCPECMTALSDLEVENEEGANGELFEFAYPVDGADAEIVVATTRPETMLGDTAVAVHPDDPRYTALHGKRVRHPFVERTIPIVTDAILVDPKFGTGAVKVTPAHDFNDFATGKRHGLEEINILNLDGTMNASAGPFAGMDRKEARRAVKKALADKGLARGTKPHVLTLPRCQRSGGVVEPMISTQWFLRMKAMAENALEAVRSGKTVIIPGEWEKTYDHFLENIQDWCVSRQLWWGHADPRLARPRRPDQGGARAAARVHGRRGVVGGSRRARHLVFERALADVDARLARGDRRLQEVLSRERSRDRIRHPVLLGRAHDDVRPALHGQAPFRRILLHGLVVDETGEKMSKVKGNVIDPLALVSGSTFPEMLANTMPGVPEAEAIAKFKKAYPSAAGMGDGFPAFGADAVRFTLATYPPSNKRIALAPKRIEGNRHFLNKIWNATRLALDLLGDFAWQDPPPAPQGFYNKWIRSRFATACAAAHEGLDTFRIDEAALASYRFFWNDLCDWYLELAKPILRKGPDGAFLHPEIVPETRATLAYVLEGSLRLLHPLMPFITEELWQRVPRPASRKVSLAFGPFPTKDDERASLDPATDLWMDLLKEVISAGRTIRSEHDLDSKDEILVAVRSESPEVLSFLRGHADAIRSLLRTQGPPVFEATGGPRAPGTAVGMVASSQGPIEVLVPLKGLVTADAEKARIDRNLKKIGKDLGALEKKLGAPGFVDRAPKEVVDEARQQREALVEAKARLEAARDLAKELE